MGHGQSHTAGLATRTVSIEVLAAQNADAARLCAADRYQDAVMPFEETLAVCEAALGRDHPATLTVAGNLAVAYVAAGARDYGIELLTTNLRDRESLFGNDDPRTLTARNALAVAHRLAGNLDAALALSRQVSSQRRRLLGPAHPDTLASVMGLALALAELGDIEGAIRLLSDTIDDAEQSHGPQHSHIIALRECRGAFMMDPGF